MELTLKLSGQKVIMQHNGRLANPLNEYARRLSEIYGKRQKSTDDLVQLMLIEARGGFWETDEGTIGIPTAAVWRSIYDAAKAFKMGTTIKRVLFFDEVVEPLYIDGVNPDCDEWLKDEHHIDYRAVKVQGRKIMRARPVVPNGWSSTHTFTILDDVLDPSKLAPILERAGRLEGLGEMRPTFGTYNVELS